MTTQDDKKSALVIGETDLVANVLLPTRAGDLLRVRGHISIAGITSINEIPLFHKIALMPMEKGTVVMRGGYEIGRTTADILAGEWLHTHNLRSIRAGAILRSKK